MKKIAFFLGSMKRGGAERVISILANEYISCGYSVDIGLLLSSDVEYELDNQVSIMNFTGKTESRIQRIPFWIKSIKGYIKREKPDVIVSFAARINVIVLLASFGSDAKVFVSERNDPRYDGRGQITKCMVRMLYPFSDGIVFQTKQVQELFCESIKKKSMVILNPISVANSASKEKKKKIVSVGRLTKQKNQKMLISAFSKVVDSYPEYILQIYGSGELENELKSYIEKLGVVDKVFLCGNVMNIHEKMKDAEMFILSSDYEGLSNALLEAMMMGLPCISTKCIGVEEYIKDNENGKLVSVGNTEELKNAILYMIENQEKREKMGENAKKSSEQFCAENVLEKWHQFLNC